MRAFVALELPQEAIGQIGRIIAVLKRPVNATAPARTKIRWVRPGQAHLTLRFLGEATGDQVESIIDDLRRDLQSARQPLHFGFGQCGAFPSPSRARVLWVALDGSTGQLLEIAGVAESVAQRAGLEPSKRQFRPHVTLARVQPPTNLSGPLASLRRDRDTWTARVLSVIRSDLTPAGPEYTRLAHFDLAAGRMNG